MGETTRQGEPHEEAHTGKKRTGSLGTGLRLHGTQLWVRSGHRKAASDSCDSNSGRTRRDILRYGGSLWPIHGNEQLTHGLPTNSSFGAPGERSARMSRIG